MISFLELVIQTHEIVWSFSLLLLAAVGPLWFAFWISVPPKPPVGYKGNRSN